MARAKRKPRSRTVRRRADVAAERLTEARSRLLDLEPGGAPDRPIDVSTPTLVEPRARTVRCPRCDEPFTVKEHAARSDERGRLREATLRCRACGLERALWFRVIQPS